MVRARRHGALLFKIRLFRCLQEVCGEGEGKQLTKSKLRGARRGRAGDAPVVEAVSRREAESAHAVSSWAAALLLQGVRRQRHLRTRAAAQPVQELRRQQPL